MLSTRLNAWKSFRFPLYSLVSELYLAKFSRTGIVYGRSRNGRVALADAYLMKIRHDVAGGIQSLNGRLLVRIHVCIAPRACAPIPNGPCIPMSGRAH